MTLVVIVFFLAIIRLTTRFGLRLCLAHFALWHRTHRGLLLLLRWRRSLLRRFADLGLLLCRWRIALLGRLTHLPLRRFASLGLLLRRWRIALLGCLAHLPLRRFANLWLLLRGWRIALLR